MLLFVNYEINKSFSNYETQCKLLELWITKGINSIHEHLLSIVLRPRIFHYAHTGTC